MENCIARSTPHLSTCSHTTAHIVNHWLTWVIIVGFLVRLLLSSILPYTGMSTFEASIRTGLLHLPLILLVIWIIHRMVQLTSLRTSMHIMERGIQFIIMCRLIGIIMALMKNQGRWMVVINRSSPTRDKFLLSVFHKDSYIFLCAPIIQHSVTHYPILS